MPKLLILFLLNASLIYAQTSTKPGTLTVSKWKKFEAKNYVIQYPDKWDLDTSKQFGTAFILFSPLESPKDQFKENVNLLSQSLQGQNIDLDQLSEMTLEQLKKMITNPVIIENKRIKEGNKEYQRMIYTGEQGAYHLKWEQYYMIINDNAYVLTLTCEQTKFAMYQPMGERILNSFTVNK